MPLVFPLQAGDVLQGNMRPGAPMLHDLVFSARLHTEGTSGPATPQQMAELAAQADYYRSHRKSKPGKPIHPVEVPRYTVDYRVLDPLFKVPARSGKQPTLEFAIAAFDLDGIVLNGVVNDATPESSTQSDENKSGIYRVHQSLLVPRKAVSIRVGVRDRTTDWMGTLEIPLPLKPEAVVQTSGSPHY